jgi:hypothetical protein
MKRAAIGIAVAVLLSSLAAGDLHSATDGGGYPPFGVSRDEPFHSLNPDTSASGAPVNSSGSAASTTFGFDLILLTLYPASVWSCRGIRRYGRCLLWSL